MMIALEKVTPALQLRPFLVSSIRSICGGVNFLFTHQLKKRMVDIHFPMFFCELWYQEFSGVNLLFSKICWYWLGDLPASHIFDSVFLGKNASKAAGLVGPSSWKLVTPVVGRRYPDEVFSFIRGMGLLGAQSRQETEVVWWEWWEMGRGKVGFDGGIPVC